MSRGGREGRIFVRLALLSAAAAVCAALVQPLIVARVAPSIEALVAQLPAPSASASASAAAPVSAPATAPASASASASAAAPAATSSLLPRIVAARPIASARAAAAVPHVTRAEIDDAIAHELDGASAKLVRDGEGAPIGLAIQRPGRLARLGVASGDVLFAANGVRIRTADEGLAALAQLEKATKVVVTFRRGEGSYSIVVDVAP
jgi:hypothetical protein